MNLFEKRINQNLFDQKMDFYSRSMNDFDLNSNKNKDFEQNNMNNQNKNNVENSPQLKQTNQRNQFKLKNVAAVFVILTLIVTSLFIYFKFTNGTDNDQIVNYLANYPTAKKVNNMKQFIDSNNNGYVISTKDSKVETSLENFTKNFNNLDLDLSDDSSNYLNLATSDLKKLFKDNRDSIYSWLKHINKIKKSEKDNKNEYKELLKDKTTDQKNNALINFYKKYGVFEDVIESNNEYKKHKDVINQIGDFTLEEKNLTNISLEKYFKSGNFETKNLISKIISPTSKKYKDLKLLTGEDVKILSLKEVIDFSATLESLNYDTIINNYKIDLKGQNLINFLTEFENFKAYLRTISKLEKNSDNDLLKIIELQKLVTNVQSTFSTSDLNINQEYCLQNYQNVVNEVIKDSKTQQKISDEINGIDTNNSDLDSKSNSNSENGSEAKSEVKDNKKKSEKKSCYDVMNKYLKATTQNPSYDNVKGVETTVSSVNLTSLDSSSYGKNIVFIKFKTNQDAKNYLSSYDDNVQNLIDKKQNAQVNSVYYNGSNMVFLIPYAKNAQVDKYLSKFNISSWKYYDYFEQVASNK